MKAGEILGLLEIMAREGWPNDTRDAREWLKAMPGQADLVMAGGYGVFGHAAESHACVGCGAESFVAAKNTGERCAECQMAHIEDDVVIDALSRAICAVIVDAVKDERRHAVPTMTQVQSDEIQRKQDAKVFISKNKPAMTSDEAHAVFMIRHGVATPLERQASHDHPQPQVQVCTKCSADLAYASPGQVLCYGCRST